MDNEIKENRLISSIEKYMDNTEELRDVIYRLIDKKEKKYKLSIIMTKHKQLLKALEILLKNY